MVVTRDDRFSEQCENVLSTLVSSIRKIAWDNLEQDALDGQSLVFFDVREPGHDVKGLLEFLAREHNRAKVFIVSDQRDSDLVLNWMRAGAADCLLFPLDSEEVSEAVRRVAEHPSQKTRGGHMTALFTLKGGQGTTSLAINLTDHIAMLTGQKCLLADLNLYTGHVSVGLDMKCSYTPFDLYQDLGRADEDLLFSSMEQHERGFWVLGMSEQVGDLDQISGEGMGQLLKFLRQNMGHTIMDLPHDLSGQTLACLDEADKILVVVQQDFVSLKSAQLTLLVFSDLGYPEDKISIIVNRYQERSDLQLQDIERALKQPVWATVKNDFKAMTQSFNHGQTVAATAQQSRINQDFSGIAGLVTQIAPPLKDKSPWWLKLPIFLGQRGGNES